MKLARFTAAFIVGGVFLSTAVADDAPPKHPDTVRREGVPQGNVRDGVFDQSTVYPNTVRRYSVYVPAGDRFQEPPALMVFLDGHAYVRAGGDFDVPAVFDNLIAAGEMPPTVAVLVDPGFYLKQLENGKLPEKRGWNPRPGNRSVEYDTVSDEFNTFLDEFLAVVLEGVEVSQDPARRAVCGSSSGGICAFKVAWFEPAKWGKVITHIGSFTDIRGGHNFPPMIRKADTKPIRVALQDGSGDLDNQFGNWWLANLQMEKALAFKGYDFKTYWGDGGHNGRDAGRVFPDELKWLWRDWKSQ